VYYPQKERSRKARPLRVVFRVQLGRRRWTVACCGEGSHLGGRISGREISEDGTSDDCRCDEKEVIGSCVSNPHIEERDGGVVASLAISVVVLAAAAAVPVFFPSLRTQSYLLELEWVFLYACFDAEVAAAF
jgi:hypothetical protein